MKIRYEMQIEAPDGWETETIVRSVKEARRCFPSFRCGWARDGYKTRLLKVTETIIPMPK